MKDLKRDPYGHVYFSASRYCYETEDTDYCNARLDSKESKKILILWLYRKIIM